MGTGHQSSTPFQELEEEGKVGKRERMSRCLPCCKVPTKSGPMRDALKNLESAEVTVNLTAPFFTCQWFWLQAKGLNIANIALLLAVLAVSATTNAQLQQQRDANEHAQSTLSQLNAALSAAQTQSDDLQQSAQALNRFNATLDWAIANGLPQLAGFAQNFSIYAAETDTLVGLALANVSVTKFELSGTFSWTPSANLLYATVEVVGGGGGGASAAAASASQTSVGGGGGAGGYSKRTFMNSILGGLGILNVIVGIGGAADAAGGASSFGNFHSASGGQPGNSAGVSPNAYGFGGAGGQGSGGDINFQGSNGGIAKGTSIYGFTGYGGSSGLGAQVAGEIVNGGTNPGSPGLLYGGGGSGAGTANTAAVGGKGAPGVVIITQYLAKP